MRLTYFNGRGLAETTRCMFKLADASFVDDRIEIDFKTPGDFSTMTRPDFDARKHQCEFECSMNRLPLLADGGALIAQSKAIERYVARKLGYMGDTEAESAQIDAICEHIRDFKDAYKQAKREGALDAWRPSFTQQTELLNKIVPAFLEKCTTPTLAHVALYNFYHGFFDDDEMARQALENCPKLRSMCNMIKYNPRMVIWEQERPKTAF